MTQISVNQLVDTFYAQDSLPRTRGSFEWYVFLWLIIIQSAQDVLLLFIKKNQGIHSSFILNDVLVDFFWRKLNWFTSKQEWVICQLRLTSKRWQLTNLRSETVNHSPLPPISLAQAVRNNSSFCSFRDGSLMHNFCFKWSKQPSKSSFDRMKSAQSLQSNWSIFVSGKAANVLMLMFSGGISGKRE